MWDPASSVEIDEETEIGTTVLSSPRGLGEIQVVVRRTAQGREGVLHEVVELEPGRRAVTRSLVSLYPSFGALTVEPVGPASCRLTQEFWLDLPAGVPVALVRDTRKGCRQELHRLLSRLSELAPGLPTRPDRGSSCL